MLPKISQIPPHKQTSKYCVHTQKNSHLLEATLLDNNVCSNEDTALDILCNQ